MTALSAVVGTVALVSCGRLAAGVAVMLTWPVDARAATLGVDEDFGAPTPNKLINSPSSDARAELTCDPISEGAALTAAAGALVAHDKILSTRAATPPGRPVWSTGSDPVVEAMSGRTTDGLLVLIADPAVVVVSTPRSAKADDVIDRRTREPIGCMASDRKN